MNRTQITILGFVLLIIGILSLILNFIGIRFAFLTWVDYPGRLFGFVVRIVMVMMGFVMVVLARSPIEEEEEIIDA